MSPAIPPAPPRPAWPTALGVFALCLAALVVKSPDALYQPQFWAEDGAVFFQQQQTHALPQLFIPYAGYLHLLPRLVAWLAAWAPLAWAPAIYCLAAFAINAACVGYFLHRLAPWRLAWIGFGAIFLTPTSGEIFGSLANCQWFAQLFLLAACFIPVPREGRRVAVMSLLVLAVALTGPFALLLALIHGALVAAARIGPRLRPAMSSLAEGGGRYRLVALWTGAFVQAICLALGEGPASAYSLSLLVAALGSWSQVHLVGVALLPAELFLAGLLALMAASAGLSAQRGAALFLLVLMALALLEIAAVSGRANISVLGSGMGYGDRYFFLFKLAFWLLAFDLARRVWPRARLGFVVAGLLMVLAAAHPGRFQRPPLEDKQWRRAIAPVEAGQTAVVDINPTPWTITVRPRVHGK
jgi:hypothetical protein